LSYKIKALLPEKDNPPAKHLPIIPKYLYDIKKTKTPINPTILVEYWGICVVP